MAGEKTMTVTGDISEKALEVSKKSKAMQKKPAPKLTARPAHSQCHVVVVNICSYAL